MTTNTPQSPWQNVRNIHREYADDYRVLGVVGLVLVGLIIFSGDRLSYSMNAYTELLSIIVTVVVVDRLATRRAEQQRKAELIAQMASTNNAVAVGAATLMKHLGWGFDEDRSLDGVSLRGANLQGIDLSFANLEGANLRGANLDAALLRRTNLVGVSLRKANLQGAFLRGANLQGADLSFANLVGVDLNFANLEGADLSEASLVEVDLSFANLEGVDLSEAKLNEQTVLPDAIALDDDNFTPESYWTPKTDMRKYTDPNHPEFWQPQ